MRRALSLIAYVALTCACVTPSPAQAPVPASASQAVQPASSAPPGAEYRLGPGDKLRVLVFGRTELSGEFTVSTLGRIAYPLLGEIDAAGFTQQEFSERLEAALREGVVREPDVSVEMVQYRPFYILGEVGRPGEYPYAPGLTVRSAVATAGGFTYRANTRRAYIQRAGEPHEQRYDATGAIPVQPGDTVRIPERYF